MQDEALSVWADFLRYHATVIETLEEELSAEAGMPLAWYDVLVQLDAAPEGRLRMQELAAAVVLSKSGLTRLVDRLERAGLVARASCPSDRRGTFAEITPAGRKRVRAARPVHHRGIEAHFASCLTERQLAVLREAFAALNDAQCPRVMQRLEAADAVRPTGRAGDRVDTSGA